MPGSGPNSWYVHHMRPCDPHEQDDPDPQRTGRSAPAAQIPGSAGRRVTFRLAWRTCMRRICSKSSSPTRYGAIRDLDDGREELIADSAFHMEWQERSPFVLNRDRADRYVAGAAIRPEPARAGQTFACHFAEWPAACGRLAARKCAVDA